MQYPRGPAVTGPVLNRRDLLAAAALAAPVAAAGDVSADERPVLVVVGGHPDDPETAAGGTLLVARARGWETVAVYLTAGEAGIDGRTHAEAAAIRRAEAEAACGVLGCRPVFAGQIDGAAEVTNARYAEFADVLLGLNPDLVLTHWPIDAHRDHRAASLLTYDCWQRNGGFDLAYHEVLTGEQTQSFAPTHFVNISEVEERKWDACRAHASQDPADMFARHGRMHAFRGLQFGCDAAEAFVLQHGAAGLPL